MYWVWVFLLTHDGGTVFEYELYLAGSVLHKNLWLLLKYRKVANKQVCEGSKLLKFVFPKKATKIDKIFTADFTLTT